MVTRTARPKRTDNDALAEAIARADEILERVEQRRAELLERRRARLEETIRLAEDADVRKSIRDQAQQARLDALVVSANKRLSGITADRKTLGETVKTAREQLAERKKRHAEREG